MQKEKCLHHTADPQQGLHRGCLLWLLLLFVCELRPLCAQASAALRPQLLVGAAQLSAYLPAIENKRLGLVVHASSQVADVHLLDTLLALDMRVTRIFTPEHGFNTNQEAGAAVADQNSYANIPIRSLYGARREPTASDMQAIDVLLFDLQDVGARFYTYASTLHYVMEAAAKHHQLLLVLDRPNPNGHYVDGPVLRPELRSFVGLHPIPIVHGLTLGELAMMINGEGWLSEKRRCRLRVITIQGWNHHTPYQLPLPPSPNLPSTQAIALYPSLCLFEGTPISVGRGTDHPFEVIGHPDFALGSFCFTPRSIPGAASNPKHMNKRCCGLDLRTQATPSQLLLAPLLSAYARVEDKKSFFLPYFDKLAGTTTLRKQIENNWKPSDIRDSWQADLRMYCRLRARYLLYEDSPGACFFDE